MGEGGYDHASDIDLVFSVFDSLQSKRCRCVQSQASVVQSAVCGSACCHYDLTLTR